MLNLSSDTTLERKKLKIHIRNINKHLQTDVNFFFIFEFYDHPRDNHALKKIPIILLFHISVTSLSK